MNHEEYLSASLFWKSKTVKAMPKEQLRREVHAFLSSHRVLALATGAEDYVRCSPLEYGFWNEKFYVFTEGGEKFIGLEKNPHVSFAIFDQNPGFEELKSVQVMGEATFIEPGSEEYASYAQWKKIPVVSLMRLKEQGTPVHLLCLIPKRMDILFSSFKEEGYDARQSLVFSDE